jgi:regulator of sigma E protease
MNFLLAWILFTALFWQVTHPEGMAPIAVNAKFRTDTQTLLVPTYDQAIDRGILRVEGVLLDPIPGSPAEKSGIKTGDIVSSVQGQPIQRAREFSDAIRTHKDTSEVLRFTLTRSGSTQPVQVEVIPENGKIGAYVSDNIVEYNTKIVYRFSFTDAVVHGAQETYGQAKLTLELLGNLVQKLVHPQTPTERSEATKSLTGPIGMGNLFVNLVHVNVPVSLILAIAALISINLGVFNLLPFPALDGGRFAFLTIHTVISRLSRGKMGTQKLEARANMV